MSIRPRKQTAAVAERALADLHAQAPEAVIAALSGYDSWQGWPPFDEAPPKVHDPGQRAVTHYFTLWRDTLCDLVKDVDGVCVDLFTAFNGPDGSRPPGDLVGADNTHPSQEGNDVIRDLLLAAQLL